MVYWNVWAGPVTLPATACLRWGCGIDRRFPKTLVMDICSYTSGIVLGCWTAWRWDATAETSLRSGRFVSESTLAALLANVSLLKPACRVCTAFVLFHLSMAHSAHLPPSSIVLTDA